MALTLILRRLFLALHVLDQRDEQILSAGIEFDFAFDIMLMNSANILGSAFR